MGYKRALTITPNNTTDLTTNVSAIHVGTTGNVSVVMKGATTPNTVTLFVNVQAGATLNVEVSRVHATGTTANNLVGLY